MWLTVLEILAPVLTALLAILVPALVTALFRWFQKLGLDIEQKHRDALQSALANAAMIAIARGTRNGATGAAIDYVRGSVPDAVKQFKLDDAKIVELLKPRVTAARLGAAKSKIDPEAVG
jgi:hypothetical protein